MLGNYMHGYGGSMFGIFGAFAMVIFWALVILAVVLAVKYTAGGKAPQTGGKSAMDILNMRYARGEIDKAEYDEKKKDLE